MLIQSTVLILLWLVSLNYAEHRSKQLKYHEDVISDFIPHSAYLQVGFLSLCIGLVLFGLLVSSGQWQFYLGAIGQFLVCLTRAGKFNTKRTRNDWIHILGAGLQFIQTSLGCLMQSYGVSEGLFGLALSIPIYSILGFTLRFDNGDKERIVQYPLMLWFQINQGQYWLGYPWTVL